jgi:hypothetical protein
MTGTGLTMDELVARDWERVLTQAELAATSKNVCDFCESFESDADIFPWPAELQTAEAQIKAAVALTRHPSGETPRTVRGLEAMLVLLNIAPALQAGFISVEHLAVVKFSNRDGTLTIEPVVRQH